MSFTTLLLTLNCRAKKVRATPNSCLVLTCGEGEERLRAALGSLGDGRTDPLGEETRQRDDDGDEQQPRPDHGQAPHRQQPPACGTTLCVGDSLNRVKSHQVWGCQS